MLPSENLNEAMLSIAKRLTNTGTPIEVVDLAYIRRTFSSVYSSRVIGRAVGLLVQEGTLIQVKTNRTPAGFMTTLYTIPSRVTCHNNFVCNVVGMYDTFHRVTFKSEHYERFELKQVSEFYAPLPESRTRMRGGLSDDEYLQAILEEYFNGVNRNPLELNHKIVQRDLKPIFQEHMTSLKDYNLNFPILLNSAVELGILKPVKHMTSNRSKPVWILTLPEWHKNGFLVKPRSSHRIKLSVDNEHHTVGHYLSTEGMEVETARNITSNYVELTDKDLNVVIQLLPEDAPLRNYLQSIYDARQTLIS